MAPLWTEKMDQRQGWAKMRELLGSYLDRKMLASDTHNTKRQLLCILHQLIFFTQRGVEDCCKDYFGISQRHHTASEIVDFRKHPPPLLIPFQLEHPMALMRFYSQAPRAI